jgi:tetratricopeptide (TPR) repeat protein
MSIYRCKFVLLFIFGFTAAFYSVASENKIDSLILELQNKDLDALKEADLLKDLANQYYVAEDYASALENASKALSIFTKIKQNRERAETLKLIGDIYSNVNDFDKSVEHYLNSLAIAESISDFDMIALINSELGRLFIKISEFPKALERFNLAISFYEVLPDKYSKNLVTNYANNLW